MKRPFLIWAFLAVVIPCKADVIVVDPNGSADYTTIQAAIDASWDGDTVIVRPSTYMEEILFNGRAITLTSEDPNESDIVENTIITGGVSFDSGETSDSVITGFTITDTGISCSGSSPTISKNIITNCGGRAYGAGIRGYYNAQPTIINNVITNNGESYCVGGGLGGCDGTISNNIICGNTASDGGGLYICDGEISNNTISGNTVRYDGGGLRNCDGTISNNTISGNVAKDDGGGLWECDGEISNNIISGNTSHDRSGGLYNCDGTISNNIISGNTAIYGGGLASCDGTICNNTISGNYAIDGGGLWYCDVIKNNIIAFNKADNEGGGMYGGSGNAYNDFWMNEGGNLAGGATKGTGDITFNPLFAIEGYWDGSVWVEGDYHLKSEVGRWDPNNGIWITDTVTSRCIDAGNPGCPLGDEPNEPSNVRINMGAYGGTVEASKTPPEWGLLPDLTNDWMVDYEDFVHQSKDWQEIANCQPGDLNRDGTVNLPDISIMALHWLEDNNP